MSLLPTLKMFLFLEINFGNHLPNNFSKFWKYSGEISSKDIQDGVKISFQNILKRYSWSSVIVKPLPLRFTVILLGSETYNFMERYYDLWSFIPDLGLFSTISEFKR